MLQGNVKTRQSNWWWYGDYSWFLNFGAPWFNRGGNASRGSDAGVFSFVSSWGSVYSGDGSRVALVILP